MTPSKKLKDKYRQLKLCVDCGKGPLSTKAHCEGCRLKALARTKLYDMRNRSKVLKTKRKCQHQSWEPLKREVLTHYSPKKRLRCSWRGCSINDLDMLSLDHVNNDGYKHIRPGRTSRVSGRELYRWTKDNNYPDTFQTLCWNHQWKKRIAYLKKRQCV
jgi:hypothetical protein